MQIHLVLPGLLWPSATLLGPAADLALPGLHQLLGFGQRQIADFEPFDRQIARLFGLDADPLPLGTLRRLGEPTTTPATDEDGDGEWLCADPVNLSFAREHLLLAEFPADDISAAEAGELLAALNENFADIGYFEASTPTRWYVRLAQPTRAKLFPLHDVVGRPVKHFLPEGDDARLWQRTLNEVQIVLHNHPVSQAREAAGRRPVNSLWFWGAGQLETAPRTPMAAVQASDPVSIGLARAAGAQPSAPDPVQALAQDTLVVLDTLLRPALELDLDTWRKGLVALERDWFSPLAQALRSGTLQHLTLSAPGDRSTLQLRAGARDHWRFWRKPLTLDALLKSMAPPPAVQPTPDQPTQ
ncbi:MAG: hypothetical protein M0P63_03200 [Azoarcus sp.]|jgi:hypothetical protein|nr:hypothetical protein [Azoarcus sp.]